MTGLKPEKPFIISDITFKLYLDGLDIIDPLRLEITGLLLGGRNFSSSVRKVCSCLFGRSAWFERVLSLSSSFSSPSTLQTVLNCTLGKAELVAVLQEHRGEFLKALWRFFFTKGRRGDWRGDVKSFSSLLVSDCDRMRKRGELEPGEGWFWWENMSGVSNRKHRTRQH